MTIIKVWFKLRQTPTYQLVFSCMEPRDMKPTLLLLKALLLLGDYSTNMSSLSLTEIISNQTSANKKNNQKRPQTIKP